MRPMYDIYLLEVEWTWDHCNREFATLTVEGREGQRYESGFDVLVDPTAREDEKRYKLEELRGVAKALRRHDGGHESAELVRLFKVTDIELPDRFERVTSLNMKLELLCNFDREGEPVTPEKAA